MINHADAWRIQMHIAIPDCAEVEVEGGKGKKHVEYNIHVDGVYHCSVGVNGLIDAVDVLE